MTRLGSIAATAVGTHWFLSACGKLDPPEVGVSTPSPSPSPSPTPTPSASATQTVSSCVSTGSSATIAFNHGHSLTLPKEDVTAGSDKTYAITGSAGHPHDITVTSAQFATLSAGTTVTVTSTSGSGHTHEVTLACP